MKKSVKKNTKKLDKSKMKKVSRGRKPSNKSKDSKVKKMIKLAKMKKGKKIKFNGIEGKICKLGMLELEIETKKGDTIYLPNSLLIKSKVWLLR